MSKTRIEGQRDDGFTLVELLIVIGLMGILMATLSAVFTVIIKTTPDADERIDDARSVQGLVTWLPQDIDATPPSGFNRDLTYWPCSGTAPTDSHNILALAWSETFDSVTTVDYAASYRYELDGTEWRMVRYTCQDAGSARRQNMTSELAPWGIPRPASVMFCSAPVDESTGQCDPSDVVPNSVTAPPVVEAMLISVAHPNGDVSSFDAAPKNPDELLADDPDAVTNFGPTASTPNIPLVMTGGDTVVLYVDSSHGVADPELDPMSVAVNSFEPAPADVTVTTADPLEVTIVADNSAPAGLRDDLVLIVSDNYGGSVEITVTITMLPTANGAPTATTAFYPVSVDASTDVILPLDLTHGLSDPNGDAMTAAVIGRDPSYFRGGPRAGAPLGDLELELDVGGAVGATTIVDVRISDPYGAFVDIQVEVTITAPSTNNAPSVPTTDVPLSMYAGDIITLSVVDPAGHNASDPDGDAFSVALDPGGTVPPEIIVTTSGTDVTIEADLAISDGPAGVVELLVTDIHGDSTPATVTITILLTPPPPPDCVLGTLSASPSPGDRVGGSSAPGAKKLDGDILVTLDYTGTCDGLTLTYDTGHSSGLGVSGRVFPGGSPTSILLLGRGSGGTEQWTPAVHTLTASTTSAVSPNSVTFDLTIT